MFPDLIDIGFLHIRTYGACMAVGFLLCWTLIERLSGRKDLSNCILSMMIAGVVGARAAYVIEHWSSEFAARPQDIIRVDQGGLMFYGGLILAIIVFFAWCFVKKERPLALADLFATVIPLGHACGRIGCFFYGCCYGKDSDAWCAVVFPKFSPSWYEHGQRMVSVLPTQLFEAAALLVLFALLLVHRICQSGADETGRNGEDSHAHDTHQCADKLADGRHQGIVNHLAWVAEIFLVRPDECIPEAEFGIHPTFCKI